MDLDGDVGEVGGVPQKTAAALDAGAKLFLVPAGRGRSRPATAPATALNVVGVDTIDDALRALREHGGAPVTRARQAAA